MRQAALLLGLCALGTPVFADAPVDASKLPPPASQSIDFTRDVQPVFEQSCYPCHGPEKQRSGYRLDDKGVALAGGESSAPNILAGMSAASPLIHYVAGLVEDMLMPSKGYPLTGEQIGILRAWIDQGAVWPDDGRVPVAEKWKSHRSFRPLARPETPHVPPGGANTPIDAFITAKLKENGLALSPPAYTRALISAIPVPNPRKHRDRIILQGDVPSPINPPSGCPFHTRCPHVQERCRIEKPALRTVAAAAGVEQQVACHFDL